MNQKAPTFVEQRVEQPCHDVARPGPAPHFLEALLVDIEYHDALVDRARHGHLQPRVVDDVVELRDERHFVPARRMADEEQHDDEPEDDADEVLLHARSVGPAEPCAGRGAAPRLIPSGRTPS
jgi:hypothetical protein